LPLPPTVVGPNIEVLVERPLRGEALSRRFEPRVVRPCWGRGRVVRAKRVEPAGHKEVGRPWGR
jgi:hypothetical protein